MRNDAMVQTPLSPIDKTLEEKLFNALVAYFKNENYKLGLGVTDEGIEAVCKTLLYREEDLLDAFQSWQVGEKSILEEYHKEELEIIDYLHLISTEIRKQFGQYATPVSIVRHILKSAGYAPTEHILNKKLIDPACGSGAFLVESARIYLSALKKAGKPIYRWYPMVISSLIGIDIDPIACFFARLNLSMLLAPAVLEFVAKNSVGKLNSLPVYCADTLQFFSGGKSQGYLYGLPNFSLKSRFNFVVGNPPYFKIKDLSDELKNVFSESIYGHPNAYGLFIHAGIEMLIKEGRLGFIVPRSMLSGLYFKNLRNFVEKSTSIREIVYISERKKIFEDVLHGTMILSLERGKKDNSSVNVTFAQSTRDIDTTSTIVHVDKDQVIQRLNGTTVWFVADSLGVYNIIDRIIREHPLLSGEEINCRAKTGQIVWNRVKPLLTVTPETNSLPLVWATDVGKFSFSFNRLGAVRPCYLKVKQKTESLIVREPGILVQRITADEQPSRIVACIPEEFCKKEQKGYFVENHLNLIQQIGVKNIIDLYFLLGVLNSEIVEFFFRAMNGNTQVSATELNLLPIPIGKFEHEISKVAKLIPKSSARKKNLLDELNRLVAKAYGLNDKEQKFVKKFLSNRRGYDN